MAKQSKAARRVIRFTDAIISLCLVMCLIVTISVLTEYHRLDTVLGASEIAALLAVWGGELLLIVVRQVLGSDLPGRRKENEDDV